MRSIRPTRILATDVQVLSSGEGQFLVRGWLASLLVSGSSASLVQQVLAAANEPRTVLEIAAVTTLRASTVELVVDRLVNYGLLESRDATMRSLDDDSRQLTAGSDNCAVVLVHDRDLRRAVARALPSDADVQLVSDVENLAALANRVQAKFIVPRDLVDYGAGHLGSVLSDALSLICYWPDGDQGAVLADLSGSTLCFDCFERREKSGLMLNDGGQARRAMEGWSSVARGVKLSLGTLIAHISTKKDESASSIGGVIYRVTPHQVTWSRALGLAVCKTCGPAFEDREQLLLNAPAGILAPQVVETVHSVLEDEPREVTLASHDTLTADEVSFRCRESLGTAGWQLAKVLDDFRAMYGEWGIIRAMRLETPPVAAGQFSALVADLADLRRISASGGRWQLYNAAGVGWTFAEALRRCMNEATERYCALTHGVAADLVWGRADDLAGAVPVEKFATFSEEEERHQGGKSFRSATSDSVVGWVRGRNLISDSAVLVPAQIALFGYSSDSVEDPIQPNSNKGLSAGPSSTHCLIHGLCEIIESDALLIHFLNRTRVPEISLRNLRHVKITALRLAITAVGGKLRAWDFSTDISVPTILVALEFGTTLKFGMATRLDPFDALEHAALEAMQTACRASKRLFESALLKFRGMPPLSWVTTRERARALTVSSDYIAALGWLTNRHDSCEFEEYAASYAGFGALPATQLARVVELFESKSLTPIGVDVSTSDVTAATGLQVWRAVVPGMQPFSIGSLQARANERLYAVPVRMGYRSQRLTERSLNSWPHPCP